jgi:SAM-dependent methyltransferase
VEGAVVHQNVFGRTREDALGVARGTLDVVRCAACGLTRNAAFDSSRVRYDASYDVDQSRSPRFVAHLDEVCARIEARCAPSALDVVEIGCGQGTFLGHLAARLGSRLRSAVGFDPAFRGEQALPANVRVVPRAFDAASLAGLAAAPMLVVLRHTIEHVPSPVAFLRSIVAALRGAPIDVFVETPDADYTIRNKVVHDLYYEHCSLCSARALEQTMRAVGLSDIAVDRAFGGEYLVAFASSDPAGAAPGRAEAARRAEPTAPEATRHEVAAFADACAAFGPRWRARIREARECGKVAVWGAAGKGVTFLGLVDPGGDLVDAVVDTHPAKAGLFVPGTAHPIVGPDRAQALGVRTVIVMNDNYVAEIEARCRASGWDAEVWRAPL